MEDYKNRRRNLLVRAMWRCQDALDAYLERKNALRYVKVQPCLDGEVVEPH